VSLNLGLSSSSPSTTTFLLSSLGGFAINPGWPPIVGCIPFLGPAGLNALSWSGSPGRSGSTAADYAVWVRLRGAGGASGFP